MAGGCFSGRRTGGCLFGFMYGLNIPDLRSNETSRKFTSFLLASIVSFKLLSLRVLHTSFLIFLISLGGGVHRICLGHRPCIVRGYFCTVDVVETKCRSLPTCTFQRRQRFPLFHRNSSL